MEIIFIAGCSRSGSTVFERMLSDAVGATSVGEARWLPYRGLLVNEMCGCGSRVNECSFWQGLESVNYDIEEAQLLNQCMEYFDTLRGVVPLYVPFLRTRKWKRFYDVYSIYIKKLYCDIDSIGNGNPIIDASKRPFYFLVLKRCLEEYQPEIRFVHFVRSPLGVVNSWRRKKLRKELYWKTEYMPRKNVVVGSIYWCAYIFVCEFVRIRSKGVLVKYSDFCENPPAVVNSAGISSSAEGFTIYHPVSGNPSRFDSTGIKEDLSYHEVLSSFHKMIIRLIAFPAIVLLYFTKSK